MKEMYKDNAGNWRYGVKGEELGVSYSADSIPIKWLCDYALSTNNAAIFWPMFTKWYKEKENE